MNSVNMDPCSQATINWHLKPTVLFFPSQLTWIHEDIMRLNSFWRLDSLPKCSCQLEKKKWKKTHNRLRGNS